jgi:FlaA1/EpsC-like NDP-sugar epimerase
MSLNAEIAEFHGRAARASRSAERRRMLLRYRRIPIIALHIVLIAVSNYLAFWLKFDGRIPVTEIAEFLNLLPWLILIRVLVFTPFKLFEGLWRYASIVDLRNIIVAAVLSSLLFYLFVHGFLHQIQYPRSIFIIDTLILISLTGGVRLSRRLLSITHHFKGERKVLLYGAGDAAEMIVRDMKNNGAMYRYDPIGFIDDNPAKIGQRIHGVPVLGSGEDVSKIVEAYKPDEVLLAIPSASGAQIRRMLSDVAAFKGPIKTLPTLDKLGNARVGVSQIQNLSIEDLLDRLPVGLDLRPVNDLVRGRNVLITGAGGSIGSELTRQIARYQPARVILLDNAESALYDISMELRRSLPDLSQVAVLADIKNIGSLEKTFSEHAPQIIFHAAAYKHVPMMEDYPAEALLNNVVGTHRVIQMALQKKVEKFILISTDKAVNPTNVMGASKRIGEIYIQALAQNSSGCGSVFAAVRFGNVLGSNGSVIPLFLRQIEQGGPVTITHPEITRFFMTIPEAVQLVLQSAALARGGEIFVLDMGEQLKLLEMARHLIRLAGFIPEKEIPIQIVGLRPGEKLREELVAMDEMIVPSEVEKIMRVQSAWVANVDFVTQKIEEMERLALEGQTPAALDLLYELVPTFRPINPETSEQLRQKRAVPDPLAGLRIANQSI